MMGMKKDDSQFIDVKHLRIGLYVELDIGWMAHPFPSGSFKISSAKQIETILGLGLTRVRYVPEKSDPAPEDETTESADATDSVQDAIALERAQVLQREQMQRKQR